jgi:hypothetical protein
MYVMDGCRCLIGVDSSTNLHDRRSLDTQYCDGSHYHNSPYWGSKYEGAYFALCGRSEGTCGLTQQYGDRELIDILKTVMAEREAQQSNVELMEMTL